MSYFFNFSRPPDHALSAPAKIRSLAAVKSKKLSLTGGKKGERDKTYGAALELMKGNYWRSSEILLKMCAA